MWIFVTNGNFENVDFCQKWDFENVNFINNWNFRNVNLPKNESLKMWILPKVEIFKMWICQRMRFSTCEFCFFLQFQWNLRGFFAQNYVFLFIPSEIPEVLLLAQNSSCPRNLGKIHTKSGQNQCPGNGNFDTGSWQGVPRYANSVLCNEKAKNWDDGDKMCVSHNNLRL